MWLIHQTWLRPIIIDGTRLLSSALLLTKMYENVRKWLDDWFGSKEQQFFWRNTNCQTGGKNV